MRPTNVFCLSFTFINPSIARASLSGPCTSFSAEIDFNSRNDLYRWPVPYRCKKRGGIWPVVVTSAYHCMAFKRVSTYPHVSEFLSFLRKFYGVSLWTCWHAPTAKMTLPWAMRCISRLENLPMLNQYTSLIQSRSSFDVLTLLVVWASIVGAVLIDVKDLYHLTKNRMREKKKT